MDIQDNFICRTRRAGGGGSFLLICIEMLSRPMVGLSHTLLPQLESGFLSHLLDDDGSSLAHVAIAVILLPGGRLHPHRILYLYSLPLIWIFNDTATGERT